MTDNNTLDEQKTKHPLEHLRRTLHECIRVVELTRPNDRSFADRVYAITITSLEKTAGLVMYHIGKTS